MFVLYGFIYIFICNEVYITSFTFYVSNDKFRTMVIKIHF